MSDSPFADWSVDGFSCTQCGAPAMSLLWEPPKPFETAHVGCSRSCGLVPAFLGSQVKTLRKLWAFKRQERNTDFKSKAEGEP